MLAENVSEYLSADFNLYLTPVRGSIILFDLVGIRTFFGLKYSPRGPLD